MLALGINEMMKLSFTTRSMKFYRYVALWKVFRYVYFDYLRTFCALYIYYNHLFISGLDISLLNGNLYCVIEIYIPIF